MAANTTATSLDDFKAKLDRLNKGQFDALHTNYKSAYRLLLTKKLQLREDIQTSHRNFKATHPGGTHAAWRATQEGQELGGRKDRLNDEGMAHVDRMNVFDALKKERGWK